MSQFQLWGQCWKPHVATTLGNYQDNCQKPFHKIRQQTVDLRIHWSKFGSSTKPFRECAYALITAEGTEILAEFTSLEPLWLHFFFSVYDYSIYTRFYFEFLNECTWCTVDICRTFRARMLYLCKHAVCSWKGVCFFYESVETCTPVNMQNGTYHLTRWCPMCIFRASCAQGKFDGNFFLENGKRTPYYPPSLY